MKSLTAHLDKFQLQIRYYHGPGGGEVRHRNLWLLTGSPPPPTPAWIVVSGIEARLARNIISDLADTGFFGRALDLTKVSMGPPLGPCYHLFVSAGDDARYLEPLGWGAEMREHLWALRKVLEGDAARAMDRLLKELEAQEAMKRLRPKFTPRERLARAEKALSERRYDDCLAEAKEALAAGTDGLEVDGAYTVMGSAYESKGEFESAVTAYQRAVEIAQEHHPKGSTEARLGPRIRTLEARLQEEGPGAKTPTTAWGRLGGDSLQMGLSSQRGSYETGARMDFTVHVRNAGNKVSRALADPADPHYWRRCHPMFAPAGATPIEATRIAEVGESYEIRDVRFVPGEKRSGNLSLEKGNWHFRRFTRVEGPRRSGWLELAPGRYVVTVNVGGLTSGGVKIEITAKSKEAGQTLAKAVRIRGAGFLMEPPDDEERSGLYAVPFLEGARRHYPTEFRMAADGKARPLPAGWQHVTLVGKLPGRVGRLDYFKPRDGSMKGKDIEFPARFIRYAGDTSGRPASRYVYVVADTPLLGPGRYRARITFEEFQYYDLKDKTKVEPTLPNAPARFGPLTCEFELVAEAVRKVK